MTMIDRVARAMFEATNEHDETWDTEAQEIKTTYLIMARAAIEAMREPTDTMVMAAEWAEPEYREDDTDMGATYKAEWRAMIDAALNEQVSG